MFEEGPGDFQGVSKQDRVDFKTVAFFAINDCRKSLSALEANKKGTYTDNTKFEVAWSHLLTLNALLSAFDEDFDREKIGSKYQMTRESMGRWLSDLIALMAENSLLVERIIGDLIQSKKAKMEEEARKKKKKLGIELEKEEE